MKLAIAVIALVFMAVGGLFALLNWSMVYLSWRTGRNHSCVPFLGAGFMAAGLLLLPETRGYAWISILLDFGTLMFLIALPWIVLDYWKSRR